MKGRHQTGVLKEHEINEVKQRLKNGEKIHKIAKNFRVTSRTIRWHKNGYS